jgi:myo-inositol-1(or 4)-monophosphatase
MPKCDAVTDFSSDSQANLFWSEVLTFAEATTKRVGLQLLQDFGHTTAMEKPDGTLVTQSDQWADEELRRAIQTAFPDHGVLSEEVAHIFPATDWCWIIDPIDGTTNFTRGIPLWGISLGLLYRGTPVFGYVYLPPVQQAFHGFWYGESGLRGPMGAFLNHALIQVSAADPSGNQFLNLCARSIKVLQSPRPIPCKIRMLGVATYNLLTIATGAALGSIEATPKIWDIAAVWVIVQAAGGVWHDLSAPQSDRPSGSQSSHMFPLQPGQDYGSCGYPTLAVSQPELLAVFLPLVEFLKSPSP